VVQPLLEVKDLTTEFVSPRGIVKAVDNLSFTIAPGETLGIVGESGSGKSATALSLLRLIAPPGRISAGTLLFEGEDLLRKSEREMRDVRGKSIAMVFQQVMTALDPVHRVGEQIMDVLRVHLRMSPQQARERAIEILGAVRMPSPEQVMRRFPHELSGGMRQRAMIAIALACRPKLLIADEITTALDVTVQAQILDLLDDIRREFNLAMLFISHDLAVIARVCDRIGVMYAGRMVEYTDKYRLFETNMHPYTNALLEAVPRRKEDELRPIAGSVPELSSLPSGCSFHPRCSRMEPSCTREAPQLREWEPDHWAACHFPRQSVPVAQPA